MTPTTLSPLVQRTDVWLPSPGPDRVCIGVDEHATQVDPRSASGRRAARIWFLIGTWGSPTHYAEGRPRCLALREPRSGREVDVLVGWSATCPPGGAARLASFASTHADPRVALEEWIDAALQDELRREIDALANGGQGRVDAACVRIRSRAMKETGLELTVNAVPAPADGNWPEDLWWNEGVSVSLKDLDVASIRLGIRLEPDPLAYRLRPTPFATPHGRREAILSHVQNLLRAQVGFDEIVASPEGVRGLVAASLSKMIVTAGLKVSGFTLDLLSPAVDLNASFPVTAAAETEILSPASAPGFVMQRVQLHYRGELKVTRPGDWVRSGGQQLQDLMEKELRDAARLALFHARPSQLRGDVSTFETAIVRRLETALARFGYSADAQTLRLWPATGQQPPHVDREHGFSASIGNTGEEVRLRARIVLYGENLDLWLDMGAPEPGGAACSALVTCTRRVLASADRADVYEAFPVQAAKVREQFRATLAAVGWVPDVLDLRCEDSPPPLREVISIARTTQELALAEGALHRPLWASAGLQVSDRLVGRRTQDAATEQRMERLLWRVVAEVVRPLKLSRVVLDPLSVRRAVEDGLRPEAASEGYELTDLQVGLVDPPVFAPRGHTTYVKEPIHAFVGPLRRPLQLDCSLEVRVVDPAPLIDLEEESLTAWATVAFQSAVDRALFDRKLTDLIASFEDAQRAIQKDFFDAVQKVGLEAREFIVRPHTEGIELLRQFQVEVPEASYTSARDRTSLGVKLTITGRLAGLEPVSAMLDRGDSVLEWIAKAAAEATRRTLRTVEPAAFYTGFPRAAAGDGAVECLIERSVQEALKTLQVEDLVVIPTQTVSVALLRLQELMAEPMELKLSVALPSGQGLLELHGEFLIDGLAADPPSDARQQPLGADAFQRFEQRPAGREQLQEAVRGHLERALPRLSERELCTQGEEESLQQERKVAGIIRAFLKDSYGLGGFLRSWGRGLTPAEIAQAERVAGGVQLGRSIGDAARSALELASRQYFELLSQGRLTDAEHQREVFRITATAAAPMFGVEGHGVRGKDDADRPHPSIPGLELPAWPIMTAAPAGLLAEAPYVPVQIEPEVWRTAEGATIQLRIPVRARNRAQGARLDVQRCRDLLGQAVAASVSVLDGARMHLGLSKADERSAAPVEILQSALRDVADAHSIELAEPIEISLVPDDADRAYAELHARPQQVRHEVIQGIEGTAAYLVVLRYECVSEGCWGVYAQTWSGLKDAHDQLALEIATVVQGMEPDSRRPADEDGQVLLKEKVSPAIIGFASRRWGLAVSVDTVRYEAPTDDIARKYLEDEILSKIEEARILRERRLAETEAPELDRADLEARIARLGDEIEKLRRRLERLGKRRVGSDQV